MMMMILVKFQSQHMVFIVNTNKIDTSSIQNNRYNQNASKTIKNHQKALRPQAKSYTEKGDRVSGVSAMAEPAGCILRSYRINCIVELTINVHFITSSISHTTTIKIAVPSDVCLYGRECRFDRVEVR